MTDTLHADADDLLHWLNAHSVSIADGMPFSAMQERWLATHRPVAQLRSGLEWLFAQRLLTMTPGLAQPHVRLTGKGFEHLLLEMDRARLLDKAEQSPLAAPVAAAATPAPAAPAASPKAASLPQAASPAAPPPAPVVPILPPPAAPVLEARTPERFIDPGKPPTEIGLRNQVLMIFRDLKLVAGQQLIATTLTRYWQESGQRAEYLRAAMDIMLRDDYLQPAVKRYENYWTLTPTGHAFITAPLSHASLLALAQPLTRIEDSLSDEELRKKGLALFKRADSQAYPALESQWRHGRDALIHALDLLMKAGDLELSRGEPMTFVLSARGAGRRR